jgi:hypothetical protein
MALSGTHIACAFAGNSEVRELAVEVFRPAIWSETMASGGTTTNRAPESPRPETGDAIFSVFSTADIFVAIGPSPNATTGPRFFVPSRTQADFAAPAGDRLAWINA